MGSLKNLLVWQYHVHLIFIAVGITAYAIHKGMTPDSILGFIGILYILLIALDPIVHFIFENAPKGIRWAD